MSESSSEENTRAVSSDSPFKHAIRSAVGNVRTLEKKCFICNEIRTIDNEASNDGGIARVTREDIADIQERKNIFIMNKESHFFQDAKRLDILLSGSTLDVFTIAVFYHQSC